MYELPVQGAISDGLVYRYTSAFTPLSVYISKFELALTPTTQNGVCSFPLYFDPTFVRIFTDNAWQTFDAIYYEYGALVITYNCREKATAVFKLLQKSSIIDKTLCVMLLPNIQVNHKLS